MESKEQNKFKKTEQKQTHGYRDQTAGCRGDGVGTMGEKGEGIEKDKLVVTGMKSTSQGMQSIIL